jgi:hypothetical protein
MNSTINVDRVSFSYNQSTVDADDGTNTPIAPVRQRDASAMFGGFFYSEKHEMKHSELCEVRALANNTAKALVVQQP